MIKPRNSRDQRAVASLRTTSDRREPTAIHQYGAHEICRRTGATLPVWWR